MELEVKVATPERFPEVLRAVESVFGEEIDEHELARFRATLDPARVIYIEDDGDVVAGAGVYTFRSTVPGGVLPTAGVTFVGVKPSHRRKRLLTTMMRQQLNDIHERGEPIATLWASEGAIYGRFGYGLASLQGWVNVERDKVRFLNDPGPRGRIRMLPPGDALDAVAPIYDRVQLRTPGMFERSEAWWKHRLLADPKESREGMSQKFLAVWEEEGAGRAYVLYRVQQGWDAGGPTGHVEIHELIAEDPVALREIWRFALGVDLVSNVKGRYALLPIDSPLWTMLDEPRRLRTVLGDALWLRVIDVKSALEGRRYTGDGEVTFALEDDLCDWNSGVWRVVARGGRAEVTRADAGAELSLNASTLGSIYLGTFTFTQLARAGRIDERTADACRRADAFFRTDIAPYCPEIF